MEEKTVEEICEIIAKLTIGTRVQADEASKRLMQFLDAAQFGDSETVNYLVKKTGFNPNQPFPNGDYPVHIVAKLKSNACAMFLALKEGQYHLDVNVQNARKDSSLHISACLSDPDALDWLLQNTANPNLQNLDGDTPLHIAVRAEAPVIARRLLDDKLTDLTIKNKFGKTPDQVKVLSHVLKELFWDKRLSVAAMGDVEIALMWSNYNDLDLHVVCPHQEIYYSAKKCSVCLGELDVDMNAGGPNSLTPVEHIFWKNIPQDGRYSVYVNFYAQHDPQNVTGFTVKVTVKNQEISKFQKTVVKVKAKPFICYLNVLRGSVNITQ